MYILLQGQKLSLRKRRRRHDWKPPLLYDKRQSPTDPSSSLTACKQPVAIMHFRHFLTNRNVGYNAWSLVNVLPANLLFPVSFHFRLPDEHSRPDSILCATGFHLPLTHAEDVPYLFKISKRKCPFFPRNMVAFLFSITVYRNYSFTWGFHTI